MGSPDACERWLRRRSHVRGLSSLAVAPVVVALGAGATVLMYWALVGAITAVMSTCGVDVQERVIGWVSVGLVVAVFADYARKRSRGIIEYSLASEPGDQTLLLRHRGRGALALLYPDGAQNAATFVLGFLYLAPWLVSSGVWFVVKALRLFALDVRGCAAVIVLLHERRRRVPYEEIAAELPWLDFRRVFRDLRAVDGVLFLWEEPPGLALGGDIMSQLVDAVSDEAMPHGKERER